MKGTNYVAWRRRHEPEAFVFLLAIMSFSDIVPWCPKA